MKLTDIRLALRLAIASAVVALALGIAACGDSDDGDASAGGDAGSSQGQPAGTSNVADIQAPDGSSEDEQQIYAVYDYFVEGVFGGAPERACAAMTDDIRKQFETVSQKTRTCPAQIKFYFHPDKNPVVPEIAKLDVKGAEATALIKAGKSALYPIDFAKQGGEWKVNGGVPTASN